MLPTIEKRRGRGHGRGISTVEKSERFLITARRGGDLKFLLLKRSGDRNPPSARGGTETTSSTGSE